MMGASHDEAQMDVPQAHESVDSRTSVAGRRMSTAEMAPMEAAEYGFAQQLKKETVYAPGMLMPTETAYAPGSTKYTTKTFLDQRRKGGSDLGDCTGEHLSRRLRVGGASY